MYDESNENLKDTIETLKKENQSLKQENEYFKSLLLKYGIGYRKKEVIDTNRTKSFKLNLFMDYFKGRTDCYAVRFEKGDRKGYAPAVNEQYRYFTKEKRKQIPKDELYEPLSKSHYEAHLKGNKTIGIYPMHDDQTTDFLAIDFDKKSFKKDAVSFYKVAKQEGFSPLLEISRSGKGAHVWFFFETRMKAKDARKFGRILITKTMLEHRSLSLDSYDRMFPAQDSINEGDFGNLIALPLNGKSGIKGTTLFVDENFEPFKDQYGELMNTAKISKSFIEHYLLSTKTLDASNQFSTKMDKLKLSPIDFKDELIFKYNREIVISKSLLTPRSEQFFKRLASISNPDFYKKKKMRLNTYNVPRIIELFYEDDDYLYLPRGLTDTIKTLLDTQNIPYNHYDERVRPRLTPPFKYDRVLKNVQTELLNEVYKEDSGIIVAPTGFGKTILGGAIIEHYQTKTLILTNRVNLCKQWKEELIEHSNLDDVGECFEGKNTLGKMLDIATFQSIKNRLNDEHLSEQYGLILIDEVHHLAAYSFEQVIRAFNAKHLYGLTATPKRSDGLESISEMVIGRIIAKASNHSNALDKHLKVSFTSTKFNEDDDIHSMSHKLIEDPKRHSMIIHDILENYHDGKSILVLTERIEHLVKLEGSLELSKVNLVSLHGSMAAKAKKETLKKLQKEVEPPFVLLSTGKYIGEGFDDERLDTLFITMPFKWKGTLSQYVGRLNRVRSQKDTITVYDYVDIHSRIYSNMFAKRQKGYKELGFTMHTKKTNAQYLYDGSDYEKPMINDLKNAGSSIHFIVRHAHDSKLNALKSASNVSLFETPPNQNHVANMVIVDRRTVWYGSLNPFSYQKDGSKSIMRINDALLAEQMIDSHLFIQNE